MTEKDIKYMITCLEKLEYSQEDINEIVRLEREYNKECELIAEECEAEGYPAHGSNYGLRCEDLRKSYDQEEYYIHAKYEHLYEE